MLVAVWGSSNSSVLGDAVISGLGISPIQLSCFMAFWVLQVLRAAGKWGGGGAACFLASWVLQVIHVAEGEMVAWAGGVVFGRKGQTVRRTGVVCEACGGVVGSW